MKKSQEMPIQSFEKEQAISKELSVEIEAYREAQIKGRMKEAEAMLREGFIDQSGYEEMAHKTEILRAEEAERLIPGLLNNLWCHLPGGMYREGGAYPTGAIEVHQAIDAFIKQEGFGDVAEKIVRQDSALSNHAREDFLTKLFLALRAAGFSRQSLTS